jgi:hypothetical protein
MTDNVKEQEKFVHFHQVARREAVLIQPPDTLKAKVGSGGLSEQILEKAQTLLENNCVDFRPRAEMYLDALMKAIERATDQETDAEPENLIAGMLYPAMQLKANGGMFHYPLVSRIADYLLGFLEVIEEPDHDAIEIVVAFHAAIWVVVIGEVTGTGGRHGDELMAALKEACTRYFSRTQNYEHAM